MCRRRGGVVLMLVRLWTTLSHRLLRLEGEFFGVIVCSECVWLRDPVVYMRERVHCDM